MDSKSTIRVQLEYNWGTIGEGLMRNKCAMAVQLEYDKSTLYVKIGVLNKGHILMGT